MPSFLSKLLHERWDAEWESGDHCIPPLARLVERWPDDALKLLHPTVCHRCWGTGTFMVTHGGLLGWACVWCDRLTHDVDPWEAA